MIKFLAVFATAGLLGMAAPLLVEQPVVERLEPKTLQEKRWATAEIRKDKIHAVGRIIRRIEASRGRYDSVAGLSGVPWHVIGGIHNMESGGSFKRHLHEGSPLSGRTRWVPKGRPKTGSPPFTWEESALDALKYDKMAQTDWESLDDSLYRVERYNGTGYLRYHKDVPSPYLWSFTTIYTKGKYVSDGKWSSTAISKQCGVAAIWKLMMEKSPKDFAVNYFQYQR